MKVETTVQVTLDQKEIDTLENMQTLLEDLCLVMEDAHLNEVVTVVDNGFQNWRSIWSKQEIEVMLLRIKSFF